jgi:hypothetical protein
VLPCRWLGEPLGLLPDGCHRQDAVTVLAMRIAAPQAAVAEDLASPSALIPLDPLSACALSRPACRFHAGARAIIADGTGAWDLMPISAVSSGGSAIDHTPAGLSRLYRAGSLVAEVESSAYSLRVDPPSGATQLRRSVNGSADAPVIDHVTLLRFEYFGAPEPPAILDDEDLVRRRTTYGPVPPPANFDDGLDTWPAGENCLFLRGGATPLPRLAALPSDADGLARLPAALFADGPWCPDDAAPNRYDADLLRVRLVRITVRVQAQSLAVRGADRDRFGQPGAARESARTVPDLEVSVDAAIRNR